MPFRDFSDPDFTGDDEQDIIRTGRNWAALIVFCLVVGLPLALVAIAAALIYLKWAD